MTDSYNNGDILYNNGSSFVKLDVGSEDDVLQVDNVSGDLAWAKVDTDQLADDAVTLDKMAPGTGGNLITYDSYGDPAHVSTGTSGQVLISNGTGAVPTFQDAPNGLVYITSSSASGTGQYFSLENVFDSSLFHKYLLLGNGFRHSGGSGEDLFLQFGTDSGGVSWHTGSSYAWGTTQQSFSASASPGGNGGSSATAIRLNNEAYKNDTSSGSLVMWVTPFVSGNPVTQVQGSILGKAQPDSDYNLHTFAGLWDSASAVDSIRFFFSTSNITVTDLKIYGVSLS